MRGSANPIRAATFGHVRVSGGDVASIVSGPVIVPASGAGTVSTVTRTGTQVPAPAA